MKIKKYMLMISVIITTMIFNSVAYANQTIEYSEEITVANEFIKNVLNKNSYDRIIELYDVNDEVSFLYFDLSEDGYVIVDVKYNRVVEGAPSERKEITDLKSKCYYNGPLSYYRKEGDSLIDLKTMNVVKIKDIKKIDVESRVRKEELENVNRISTDFMPLADTDYTVTLEHALPNYTHIQANTCGSTAASMFVDYYDNYIDGGFVTATFDPAVWGNPERLIQQLINYIDGGISGSDCEEMRRGLQRYLSESQNVDYTVGMGPYNRATYKSLIDRDKPVLVGLSGDPDYGEHWVAAYGYYRTTTSSVRYVVVNDGYGVSGVQIDPTYIEGIVY